jgi:small-conductance mechanosensitive channel
VGRNRMVSAGKIHLSFLICDSKLDKPVNDLTLKLLRTRVRLPPGPPFFHSDSQNKQDIKIVIFIFRCLMKLRIPKLPSVQIKRPLMFWFLGSLLFIVALQTASLERRLERGWFFSDIVLSVGMVGTVVGFIMMLTGFADLNFENTEEVQALISKLGYGMSTALSTTLVGLISSIILKLQFFLLETTVEKEKNKFLP